MNSTTEEIKEVLDLEARDTSINPADDFFGYANGNWMKNNEIPSSKTGWGSFYIVRDNALERLHEILDSAAAVTDAPKGSPTQLIGDFYRSFMDTAAIEEKGLQPAQSDLDRIARLSDAREMMDEVMRMRAEGNSMMFSMYV
ncbi:MAG TPA: M13 family metallopeptidase N-terminal domain-containing protein, partial [Cryomorphaceae bacterium]|nr:M13 family metallopeptidase N-terminal domain-containing protein [Cryomorphaceae bacterium]